jgi:hypothetical protein
LALLGGQESNVELNFGVGCHQAEILVHIYIHKSNVSSPYSLVANPNVSTEGGNLLAQTSFLTNTPKRLGILRNDLVTSPEYGRLKNVKIQFLAVFPV